MNCKPGDLAFIVASFYPENIGRIVHVDSQAEQELWENPGALAWNVTADGKTPLQSNNGPHLTGHISDWRLRPIRPDADPQDVTHDEELMA